MEESNCWQVQFEFRLLRCDHRSDLCIKPETTAQSYRGANPDAHTAQTGINSAVPRERILIINIEEANLRTATAGFPTSAGKESECVNVQVDNADNEPVTVIEEIDGVRNEVPLTIVGKRNTKS
jgi:hypothetical protein